MSYSWRWQDIASLLTLEKSKYANITLDLVVVNVSVLRTAASKGVYDVSQREQGTWGIPQELVSVPCAFVRQQGSRKDMCKCFMVWLSGPEQVAR